MHLGLPCHTHIWGTPSPLPQASSALHLLGPNVAQWAPFLSWCYPTAATASLTPWILKRKRRTAQKRKCGEGRVIGWSSEFQILACGPDQAPAWFFPGMILPFPLSQPHLCRMPAVRLTGAADLGCDWLQRPLGTAVEVFASGPGRTEGAIHTMDTTLLQRPPLWKPLG